MSESLAFLDGPLAGTEKKLGSWTKISIGRSASCDVPIEDPSVSAYHCRIERKSLLFQLSDEEGSSGTTVNGRPVRSKYLLPGDVIGIGRVRIRFDFKDTSDPNQTSVALESPVAPEKIQAAARRIEEKLESHVRKAATPATVAASRQVLLLARVSTILIREDDREAILGATVDALCENLPADRGAVLLRGRDGKMAPAHVRRGAADPPKARIQVPREPVEKAAADGKGSAGHVEGRAYACVPLQGRGGPLGALYVDAPLADRAYHDDDLQLLAAVGRQLGLALEREGVLERAAAAVREAERREGDLRALLDAVAEPVFALARDGAVSFANRSARAIVGDAVGRKLAVSVPEAERAALAAALERAWSGDPAEATLQLAGVRGTPVTLPVRILPILRPAAESDEGGAAEIPPVQRLVLLGRPAGGDRV
ncbi:MAG: FHA domain-containing protein [Planctomycetales bacterium]|nr:FHA domain-containing protein [Planctomycetales bacterium]